MGVTRGLAGIKFSTSPRMNGSIRVIMTRIKVIVTIPTISFTEKKGWNGIFSGLEFNPRGLLEPDW